MSDKLDEYVAFANDLWITVLDYWSFGKKHVFLNDLERVIAKKPDEIPKNLLSKKPVKYDITEFAQITKCREDVSGILPRQLISKMFGAIRGIPLSEEKITTISNEMSTYYIPSNATLDIDMPKGPNTINVLILGCGPAGLMMANYLTLIARPRINIMIVDNRVHGETSHRLPFSRDRTYDIPFDALVPIWPEILTLIGNHTLTLPIRTTEYALLTFALAAKVNIVFTKELKDQATLEKFIAEKGFDIVYDCTGGRMNVNYLQTEQPDIFRGTVLETPDWKIVKEPNEYRVEWKSMRGRFFLAADYYNKGFFDWFIFDSRPTHEIRGTHDLNLLKPLHNKCLKLTNKKKFLQIVNTLSDDVLREDLTYNLIGQEDNRELFFTIIEQKIRHKIKVATTVNLKKHRFAYVALGDTAFSSHHAVAAGLTRTTSFMNQIAWFTQTLYKPVSKA